MGQPDVFKDQFRKCTLFLTYIIGPDVDDWVFAHADEASANRTDPQLWRALRIAFEEAFTDTGEKVVSLSKLENHKMTGSNVDKYIAGFNRLLPLAGFSANDAGVINMFRRGLQPNLLRQCIMHKSKDLVTLKDWQDEARTKQLAYWDAQQATGTLPTMKQQFYQKLGIQPKHLMNIAKRDPNAMDIDAQKTQTEIDAIHLGSDRQPQFSERQKEALKTLGRCFRCGEDKHLARDCPKFPPPARMSGVTGSFRGRGWNWQAGGRSQNPGPPRTNAQQTKALNIVDIDPATQKEWFKEAMMELEPNECADFVETFLGPDF